MRSFSVVVGLSMLLLAACGTPPARDDQANEVLQRQLDAAKAENQSLRTRLQETAPGLFRDGPPPASQCPGQVETIVRSSTGKTCADYAAVIAGWSEQCVADGACDPAKRLAELNAGASARCKAFCENRDCKRWHYAPAAKCAQQNCFVNGQCPSQCPVSDECFLKQDSETPNCWCVPPSG